jgi:hypothetical protein
MKTAALACVLVHGTLLAAYAGRVVRHGSPTGEPVRHFVVLRALPLADPEGGDPQVLVEGRLVEVPGERPIPALAGSARIEGRPSPGWWTDAPAPYATFSPAARVVVTPTILVVDGGASRPPPPSPTGGRSDRGPPLASSGRSVRVGGRAYPT